MSRHGYHDRGFGRWGGSDRSGNGWGRDDRSDQRNVGRGDRGRYNDNRSRHRNDNSSWNHQRRDRDDRDDGRGGNGGNGIRSGNNSRSNMVNFSERSGGTTSTREPTQNERKRFKSAESDHTDAEIAASADATGEPSKIEALKLDTVEDRTDHFRACVGESWQQDVDAIPNQAWQWKAGRNELAQRKAAADRVLQWMRSMTRPPRTGRGGTSSMYDSSSSSDSEDSYRNDDRRELRRQHVEFIRALPSCTPLDTGFPVVPYREGDDAFCHCPCGRSMQPWRDMYGIGTDSYVPCSEKASFRPNALVAHLKEKGGEGDAIKDIAHHALWRYLFYLYEDWFGKDFAHKSLHKTLDRGWRRADYEERRILAVHLREEKKRSKHLKLELERTEKETAHFRMLSKDQQERIERMETERKALAIEKKEKTTLTDAQFLRFKGMIIHYFARLKELDGLKTPTKISVATKLQNMEEGETSVGFSLQDFFDNLFGTRSKARAVLFGNKSDENKIAKMILSTWEITYQKAEACGSSKEAKEQKKRDTGKDEGGPSRQFLTDLFKQLDSLGIKTGQKKVKLFQKTSVGLVPITDEILDMLVKKIAKNLSPPKQADLIKRARAYLRAIGRIMLHSFSNGHTLPLNVLPNFFMKVLLHGYNENYHREDIHKHVNDALTANTETHLSWLISEECYKSGDDDSADSSGNRWTTDSIFEEYIPEKFILSRKILLGGLAEGLSTCESSSSDFDLKKGCGIAVMLNVCPFEAIQKMWFSKPTIEINDVLCILVPKYNILVDEGWEGGEAARAERQREQEAFYEEDFKRYLKDNAKKDKGFLQRFIECTTGYNYLPHDVTKDDGDDKNFSITIEFDDKLDPWGFPHFHTCTLEAVFPGDPEFFKTFVEKMDRAMAEAYNQFNME